MIKRELGIHFIVSSLIFYGLLFDSLCSQAWTAHTVLILTFELTKFQVGLGPDEIKFLNSEKYSVLVVYWNDYKVSRKTLVRPKNFKKLHQKIYCIKMY